MVMKKPVYILGIESSCDDTSAAVVCDGKVLSNITANQEVHQKYGGVVPELASRAHQSHIIPVVDAALKAANIETKDLSAIGFTKGPGLLGSLLVGTSFAKSLAMASQKPLIGINHMQAHVLAHFIEEDGKNMPPFPFLCLTVSGGHTQIVLVKDYFDMEVLGETKDDAAGEAFDKSAKILGLPYPGGPLIDKHAKQGNPEAYQFGLPKMQGLNFSFSGLKTSILYFIQEQQKQNPNFIAENLNDLCASIQHSIIQILMGKVKRAIKETGIRHLAIAGGVSANSGLRDTLLAAEKKHGWKVYIPAFQYCTDNGGMIAIAAYHKFLQGKFDPIHLTATARLSVELE